jgi:bla regulator protein blaR1
MKLREALFVPLFLAPAIAVPVFSQAPGETRPSFEVASIKPNTSGQNFVSISQQPGGRFVANGMTLRSLITLAYRIRDYQIEGAPGWASSDRWNVEARAEEGSIPLQTGPRDPNAPDPIGLRLQSLLEDRFQLKFHKEIRELPTYELTIAKGGLKLKPSADQTPYKPPEKSDPPAAPKMIRPGDPLPRRSVRMGMGELEASAIEFASFVQSLSGQLGRTVIDKTGLKGLYDIKLTWTPEMRQGAAPFGPLTAGTEVAPASDPSGVSIFTAIQEQLGLKLESAKGPAEVYVMDGVQKPSEN